MKFKIKPLEIRTNAESPLKKKRYSFTNPTTGNLVGLYVGIVVALFVADFIFAIVSDGEAFDAIFHSSSPEDYFMDFFNSIRDSSTEGVYTERNSIYPPLAVMIFRLMAWILPYESISVAYADRWDMQDDQLMNMIYLVFALFSICIITKCISDYGRDRNYRITGEIVAFSIIFSYPMLYCLERGNILILAVGLAMFFVFFRDSSNKVIRELSLICLALSAGLKIFPAILGALLLFDKQWKRAIRCVIYGVLAVVLPLVFLFTVPAPLETKAASADTSATSSEEEEEDDDDTMTANEYYISLITGTSDSDTDTYTASDDDDDEDEDEDEETTLSSMLSSISKFFTKKSSAYAVSGVSIENISYLCKYIAGICEYAAYDFAEEGSARETFFLAMYDLFCFNYETIAEALLMFTEILAVIALFILNKPWQRVFLLTYLALNFPSFSSEYSLLFAFIPFVMMLFGEKKHNTWHSIYTILFSLLFGVVPCVYIMYTGNYYTFSKLTGLIYDMRFGAMLATPVFQLIFALLIIEAIITFVTDKSGDFKLFAPPEVESAPLPEDEELWEDDEPEADGDDITAQDDSSVSDADTVDASLLSDI